jgi:glycosyltransferase involved in cell wall biosynthesis
VESVLAQTHRDVEVIVVDDGSTDGTADVAESFGPPVACHRTPNRGVSAARNLGTECAQGGFIAFLDADDGWAPTKLERQVGLLEERPDVGLCFTGAHRVDGELRVLEEIRAHDYPDFCEALLLYSQVVTACCSSFMARREVLAETEGFDSRFSQCADWDLMLRLSLRTRFAPIPEPLVLYRAAAGNMSSDIGLLERDTFAVLDRFFAGDAGRYRRLRRRVYSNHWLYVSGSYLHDGQPRQALRCLTAGLALNPLNVRQAVPSNWLRRRTPPRSR